MRRRGPVLLLALALAAALDEPAHASPAKPIKHSGIAEQTTEEARERAREATTADARARSSDAHDESRVPRMSHPTVHRHARRGRESLLGFSAALAEPRVEDRRRRVPAFPLPEPFRIGVGERMAFDVHFAGNPVGLAEAEVTAYAADPRGGPPNGAGRLQITGHAVTSGVLSLLSAMEDTMVSWVDERTGASIGNHNVVDYQGLGAQYRHRVTDIEFEGRGHIRIVDEKDGEIRSLTREVPRDVFDPLAAMAWVRTLQLKDGERAVFHVLDPRLLRVEVVGRGPKVPQVMPRIASALGVSPEDVVLLEGTLTRVDKYGEPMPGRRVYAFRAYMTQDERNLILSIETDMWLSVLRLILAEYQPAHGAPASE